MLTALAVIAVEFASIWYCLRPIYKYIWGSD